MAEREFKVEAYGVELLCDNCGNPMVAGDLVVTGPLENRVHHFPHTCSTCGIEVQTPEKFPLVRHRKVAT